MNTFSYIKDYLPLLTTILAAILTYLLGFKKGNKEKFNSQLDDNLSNILSPLIHALKQIEREQSYSIKEKMISDFFKKYSSDDTKIFKISNKYILDWYYETENLFYKFINHRTEENWSNFWIYLKKFTIMINDEFISTREIIYSDYLWLITLNKKNYLLRALYELAIMIYETTKFLLGTSPFFILCFLIDKINSKSVIPYYIKQLFVVLFMIVILIFAFLTVLLSEYISCKHMQKESYIKKFANKNLHKISKY